MIDRTVHYYQTPVARGFAEHMICENGLNPEQQQIAWDLRRYTGDTNFYAELAQLPVKRYNATSATIHQRMVSELIRLAQIGWETEQRNKN